MQSNQLSTCRILTRELRILIVQKDKLGIKYLPIEFSGIVSDMAEEGLYDESVLLLIDAFIQECKNTSDQTILDRFALVEKVLIKVQHNIKRAEEFNKLHTPQDVQS